MVLLQLVKLLLLMKVLRGELCLKVFIEPLMFGHCKYVYHITSLVHLTYTAYA